MKKTIKSLTVIALSLLLFFTACKKNNITAGSAVQEVIVTEQPSMGNNRAADSELPGEPNANLLLSESLFNALYSGQLVEAKKVGEGLYQATGILERPGPSDPVSSNPCSLANMIADYYAFRAAYDWLFISWANQLCQPYMGCYTHRCGMCITFFVQPTRPCPRLVYSSPIKIFA